jgi:hypothetical protein
VKNKSFGLKIKTRKTVVLVVLFLIFCFQKEAQLFFPTVKVEKKEAVFSSLSHLQRQVQNCFGEPLHRQKKNFVKN